MNKIFDKADSFFKLVCDKKWAWARKTICVILIVLAALSVFLLMFDPICTIDQGAIEIIPWNAFDSMKSEDVAIRSFFIVQLSCWALIAASILGVFVFLIKAIKNLSDESNVVTQTRISVIFATVIAAVYVAFA